MASSPGRSRSPPIPPATSTSPNPQHSGEVEKFAADGTPLGAWGDFSASGGNYTRARALATNAAGEVYVADGLGGQLGVYTADGAPLLQWPATYRDIAIDPASGDLLAINGTYLERLTATGTPLAKSAGSGFGAGQLGSAWALDVGAGGNVYVADTYASRIEVFAPDGSFLFSWGSHGQATGNFRFPYGLATDPAGNVYVADTANNRVQKFSAAGAYLATIGAPGRAPGRFLQPKAVATDPAGDLYVADAGEPYPDGGGARIQKFSPDGVFVTQWGDVPVPRPARPKILSGPGKRTRKRSATLRFRAAEADVTLQCRLTGKGVAKKLRRWRRCSSPKRYSHLASGKKIFNLRALRDGVSGAVARRPWTVLGP